MLKQQIMQIKRECWDNKTILFTFPSVIAIITIIALLGGISYTIYAEKAFKVLDNGGLSFSINTTNSRVFENTKWQFNSQRKSDKNSMRKVDSSFFIKNNNKDNQETTTNKSDKKEFNVNKSLTVPIIETVLLFMSMIILTGGMSNDRKDGSIYFWRSLPVSETRHVLTKLFVATVFISIIYYLIIALTSIVSISLLGVAQWLFIPENLHQNVQVSTVMAQSIKYSWSGISTAILTMVVALPLLGWVMLFSAFFNRFAFAIMLLPFVFISLVEKLGFDTSTFRDMLEAYVDLAYSSIIFMRTDFAISNDVQQLLPGIAVGVVLIAASIFVRRWKID